MMATQHAFTVHADEQRSDAWKLARLGRLTGSKAGVILGTLKSGGEPAARRDYRLQLVVERLTQTIQEEPFTNGAMQWGIDQEPAAFAAYEALTGTFAERTGFLSHNTLMVGCSLDGHIGDFEGITEFKCPKTATHIGYLKAGGVPPDYLPQITHNLWISGAAWCDFMSFDPRLPANLRTFLVRVRAQDVDLRAYALAAILFLSEVERDLDAVKGLR